MFKRTVFLLALTATTFSSAINALAEFSCVSDINYKWTPLKSQSSEASKDTPKKEGGDDSNQVFWKSVSAKGATEEEAKDKLGAVIIEEKGSALTGCKAAHENETKCLAIKFNQNIALLSTMTFSQRKEFEESIAGDCKRMTGHCNGAESSEVKCKEIKSAEAVASPAPDAKGKDKKK